MKTKEIRLMEYSDIKDNDKLIEKLMNKYSDLFDDDIDFFISDFITEKTKEMENMGYFDIDINYRIAFSQGDHVTIKAKIDFFDYCKNENLSDFLKFKDLIDVDTIQIKENSLIADINNFDTDYYIGEKCYKKLVDIFTESNLNWIQDKILFDISNLQKTYYKELSDMLLNCYSQEYFLDYVKENGICFDDNLQIYFE